MVPRACRAWVHAGFSGGVSPCLLLLPLLLLLLLLLFGVATSCPANMRLCLPGYRQVSTFHHRTTRCCLSP